MISGILDGKKATRHPPSWGCTATFSVEEELYMHVRCAKSAGDGAATTCTAIPSAGERVCFEVLSIQGDDKPQAE
jgi:hypothetical protein